MKIKYFIPIILCFFFVGACIFLYRDYIEIKNHKKEMGNIERYIQPIPSENYETSFVNMEAEPIEIEEIQKTEETEKTEEVEATEVAAVEDSIIPEMVVDYSGLKLINPDYCGWIEFPAVNISYPIVQTDNNSYYLNHTFEGNKGYMGCLYLEKNGNNLFTDRNTFIFGHNMKNGTMFGNLKKILYNRKVIEAQPYFYLYLENEIKIYYVFSCYKTVNDSDRYIYINTDESYDKYIEWALENTELENEYDFSERGDIVSLSTCFGLPGGDTRLIVHGVLIRSTNSKQLN